MKTISTVLMSLCIVAVCHGQEQIYRTVNKDGTVEFSDKNTGNGKPVTLKTTNDLGKPPALKPPAPPVEEPATPAPIYSAVAITEPADGATIVDTMGNVGVSVSVSPALRNGDQVQLLIDGEVDSTQVEPHFDLHFVNPGERVFQARVIDANDEVVESSASITVVVVRPLPHQAPPKPAPKPTPKS